MSVKCGNCKGTHETSNDVRGCYAQKSVADQARWANENFSDDWHRERGLDKPSRDPFAREMAKRVSAEFHGHGVRDNTATDNQRKYIADLRAQKGLGPLDFLGTRHEASAEIDRLKSLPDTDKAKRAGLYPTPLVSDGRYAIVTPEGVTKFYKVKNGYKRVWVDVQASDTWYPIKAPNAKRGVLTDIARNPKAAMLLYGQEIGSCGHCGRTLTDEESRAYGVGPICRSKLGW